MEFPVQGGAPEWAGRRPFPFDGVLTFANAHTDRWVLDLHQEGIPVVNCSADFMDHQIPCVLGGGCAVEATDFLVNLGREHVAFVYGSKAADVFVEDHYNVLEKVAQTHGLKPHRFSHEPSQPDLPFEYLAEPGDEKALADFLVGLPKPASVWCLSDYLGVLTIRVARHAGLSVPDELAILGVGDYRIGRVAEPPLSTIAVPGQQIGAKAARLLHSMILNKAPKDSNKVVIPCPPVMERGSTHRALTDGNLARRADVLMREHAPDGMTVNEIAALLGVSRVTLTKHCRTAFGETPSQRLRRYRLERAKQWLSVDGLAIARVAGMCGFSAQGKFCNFFKRETGSSPTAFRKTVDASPAEA